MESKSDTHDSIEIAYKPGVVGLVANHGPMEVTLSFNPDQAEQLAAALVTSARKAREAAPPAPAKVRPQ